MSANVSADRPVHNLLAGWLPPNHEVLEYWISEKIRQLERNPKPLHPVIKEFKQLIEGDPFIYMGFHRMFEQIPQRRIAQGDSTCQPQIRDYKLLLELLNQILTIAPEFEDDDVVILPMYATFYWPMSTPAGFAMFSDPRVNAQLKKVLDVWSSFLTSPESRYVLTTAERGWFGPRASKKLCDFADTFQCDPSSPYYGFASWDDFFTRRLRRGARPVAHPDDDAVIVNACESTVYHVSRGLQACERFWLKGEPYSLRHMLAHDARADAFVGGLCTRRRSARGRTTAGAAPCPARSPPSRTSPARTSRSAPPSARARTRTCTTHRRSRRARPLARSCTSRRTARRSGSWRFLLWVSWRCRAARLWCALGTACARATSSGRSTLEGRPTACSSARKRG